MARHVPGNGGPLAWNTHIYANKMGVFLPGRVDVCKMSTGNGPWTYLTHKLKSQIVCTVIAGLAKILLETA